MFRRLRDKYALVLPPSSNVGPGLYLGHGFGVIINGAARIGSNCNIQQYVTIGSNHHTPATVGDNVWIGPGVCIVEDVRIGDNAIIGAGTVVVHDVPADSTTVGNPNRIIKKNDTQSHTLLLAQR